MIYSFLRVILLENQTRFLHQKDFGVKLFVKSTLVGLLSGILVVLYKYAVEKALTVSKTIFALLHTNSFLTPFWFLALTLVGYFVGWMVEKEPIAAGSGIPQVKAAILQSLRMDWIKVLTVKFVGGVLSAFAGLSLGREGPSVQIGAAAGQGVDKILKSDSSDTSILLTCGASAGFSAAFGTPISGILFSLEELHRNFSPAILLGTMTASVTAKIVAWKIFGLERIFDFFKTAAIPDEYIEYVALLGVTTGLLGVLFSYTLLKTREIYSHMRLSKRLKTTVSFLIAGVVGLFFVDTLGGGDDLLEKVFNGAFSLRLLLVLTVVKFFFTMTSHASSAPGGIFVPMLAIGALIGSIYGNICNMFFRLPKEYVTTFAVVSMAGYFSSTVMAPLTGVVLIAEVTGSFENVLALSTVSVISYLVAKFFNSKPIYDLLLESTSVKSRDCN